jgi:hypothetical protein
MTTADPHGPGREDQDQPAEPEQPQPEPEPEPEDDDDEPAHSHPATSDQLATLAANRAILTGASFEVQHHAAASGDCPACTAVAAATFGIAIAQQLAGAGFVNGPLAPQLLTLISDTEAELRRAQN